MWLVIGALHDIEGLHTGWLGYSLKVPVTKYVAVVVVVVVEPLEVGGPTLLGVEELVLMEVLEVFWLVVFVEAGAVEDVLELDPEVEPEPLDVVELLTLSVAPPVVVAWIAANVFWASCALCVFLFLSV